MLSNLRSNKLKQRLGVQGNPQGYWGILMAIRLGTGIQGLLRPFPQEGESKESNLEGLPAGGGA